MGTSSEYKTSMTSLAGWKRADTSYLHNIQKSSHQHPSLKLLKTLPMIPEHHSRIKILDFRESSIIKVKVHKLPN
jgi:hypothetical protein